MDVLVGVIKEAIHRKLLKEMGQKYTQRIVWGFGRLDSPICLVGEAPGENEDKYGLPFVGRSGDIINAALKPAKLARDDCYITNVVKYRPPNNKTPGKRLIKEFLPILLAEIEALDPKVICTLGKTPLIALTDYDKMRAALDQEITIKIGSKTYPVVATYHPIGACMSKGGLAQFGRDIGKLGAYCGKTN